MYNLQKYLPLSHTAWRGSFPKCTLQKYTISCISFSAKFKTSDQNGRGERLSTKALHHCKYNLIPIQGRQTLLWNHFGKLKTASSSNISLPTFCLGRQASAVSNILHFIDLARVSISLPSPWDSRSIDFLINESWPSWAAHRIGAWNGTYQKPGHLLTDLTTILRLEDGCIQLGYCIF